MSISSGIYLSLLNYLDQIDRTILLAINVGLAHSVIDMIMIVISSRTLWITLSVLWLAWALVNRKYHVAKQILFIAAVLGLADFIAAQFLKPYFGRMRPCHTIELVRHAAGCGGSLGFPSNHATNGMVVATIMIAIYKWRIGLIFLGIAAIVGLSRVFLGVHYPFDILFGFVVGASVGASAYWLCRPYLGFLRNQSR